MALKFLNNGYFAGKVGIGTHIDLRRQSERVCILINHQMIEQLAVYRQRRENRNASNYKLLNPCLYN